MRDRLREELDYVNEAQNLRRGLFEHGMIHADPNLANFSFLPDGRVIVYDFGCVKSVPPSIVEDYRALCCAALDGRR